MSDSKCKEGPIPDTIYRCTIDGHAVTAVYHSRVWREAVAEPFEVECDDAATREKVLAAWKHEWEIDREEIRAGRRSPHSTPEGILQGMLENMSGGEDSVEIVQLPILEAYGIII